MSFEFATINPTSLTTYLQISQAKLDCSVKASKVLIIMATSQVFMEVGNDGVGLITLSNPPINTLDIATCEKLKDKHDEAIRRNDVKAIVLTGANGKFSSGFDLNIIQRAQKIGDLSILPRSFVAQMINTIEDGRKPTVVAIQGFAVGSGLELSMGCHARISAPQTQLAITAISYGMIPGLGGTQRLPRLVGVKKATEMMLTSQSITSEEGVKLGLINAIVPTQELLKVSRIWALDIAEGRKPLLRSLRATTKLDSLSETRAYLMTERQKAKQTARNMPEHQACIDVIEEGIIHGAYTGLQKEDEVFDALVLSNVSKAKLHVSVAQRRTLKVSGVSDVGLKPRTIEKVAVIGGEFMGTDIGTALLLSNIQVVLKEADVELLAKGIETIKGNMRSLVMEDKLVKDKAEKALSLLKGALDYSALNDVDMVIVAAVENVPLKQTIFNVLEKICPPHCILAVNASTIDLNVIGEGTNLQERIVGVHFSIPAHVTPLLELVRTNKTSVQVILDLITVAKKMKKVPIVVSNCTGFAVNRISFLYTQSAHLLVNLGVDLFRIDRVLKDFGMSMGPFELEDTTGYEVTLEVAEQFSTAFSDRSVYSPLVALLVKNGRKGKTNRKRYYIHEQGSKPKPDPSVLPIIEESRRLANIMPNDKPITVTDQEILEMTLFPVVNEACRVLDEGVVVQASDLDVASVLGMGFPSYRGGIVFWADAVGLHHIDDCLKKWSRLYGTFFKPSRFLEDRAAKGLLLNAPASRPRL